MTSDLTPSYSPEQAPKLSSRRQSWLTWWLRPKVAIPSFLMLLLLASPLLLRGYGLLKVPAAPEPFDTQAVLNLVIPDEQNAYVEYRQAISSLVDAEVSGFDGLLFERSGPRAYGYNWSALPHSIQEWVRNNRAAIEFCQQGAKKSSAQDTLAGDYQFAVLTCTDEPTSIDLLAQLLRLEAARLCYEGRPDSAWQVLLTGLRMSNHIGQHGGNSELIAGLSIARSMTDALARWAHDPVVTKELLLVVLREFNEETVRRPPLSTAFQIDHLAKRRDAGLSSVLTAVGPIQVKYGWERVLDWDRFGLYSLGEPELFARCLNHETRNYLSQVDKPRRERSRQHSDNYYFYPDPASAGTMPTPEQIEGYFDHSILEPFRSPNGIDFSDQFQAKFQLVTAVLALEIYLREHSHCPKTLAELVPHIIPEIPDDLFETSPAPLKYYRAPGFARVWSVGLDGVNDDGRMDQMQDITYVLGWQDSGSRPASATTSHDRSD